MTDTHLLHSYLIGDVHLVAIVYLYSKRVSFSDLAAYIISKRDSDMFKRVFEDFKRFFIQLPELYVILPEEQMATPYLF